VSYRLKYTQTFEKQIEKIKKKDKALMEEKLQQIPYTGKPLEYRLAPYRSVRVKGKYRLVYRVDRVDEEEKEVLLVAFGDRKEIYKFMMFLRGE